MPDFVECTAVAIRYIQFANFVPLVKIRKIAYPKCLGTSVMKVR